MKAKDNLPAGYDYLLCKGADCCLADSCVRFLLSRRAKEQGVEYRLVYHQPDKNKEGGCALYWNVTDNK